MFFRRKWYYFTQKISKTLIEYENICIDIPIRSPIHDFIKIGTHFYLLSNQNEVHHKWNPNLRITLISYIECYKVTVSYNGSFETERFFYDAWVRECVVGIVYFHSNGNKFYDSGWYILREMTQL